jgi:hypothetical protein
MNYDDDAMTRALNNHWGNDATWDQYKAKRFALMSASDRVRELKGVDNWLETQTRPTREHAAMWLKKRELENIHDALLRANR